MTLPIRNSRVRTPKGTFFLREVGHGPTLLFLHGTWTDSSQWVPLMTQLGAQFHCIAPDLLGFGESSQLPLKSYSIDTEVAGLNDCLAHLRLSPQIIIADAIGAWVAIRYCLHNPQSVRRLIIMASEGISHPVLDQRWQQYRWLARSWDPRYWLIRGFTPLIRACGGNRWCNRVQQTRRQLREKAAACRLLFQRRKTSLQAEWLNEVLPQIKTPMVILDPDDATPITRIANQCLHSLAPNAHLRSIAGEDTTIWHQAIPEILPLVQSELIDTQLR